jgi:hypothetical protein
VQDIVRFFWERYRRAVQMDEANRINGKNIRFWIEAEEWIAAYKETLSSNGKKDFDKEWKKLEDYYQEWQDATPKKQSTMPSPFKNTFGK